VIRGHWRTQALWFLWLAVALFSNCDREAPRLTSEQSRMPSLSSSVKSARRAY